MQLVCVLEWLGGFIRTRLGCHSNAICGSSCFQENSARRRTPAEKAELLRKRSEVCPKSSSGSRRPHSDHPVSQALSGPCE